MPQTIQPDISKQADQFPIILASNSPYRKQLLIKLGISFQCIPPEFTEIIGDCAEPDKIAINLAEGKARSLAKKFTNHLIIGSDQTASVNKTILTKPGSKARAVEQLMACSGQKVNFYTSVVLLNSRNNLLQEACEKVKVHFRKLSKNEITRYVDIDLPLNCCGSFKIESLGISLMNSVESQDPTALIGLPMISLCAMLRNQGYKIP